MAATSARQIATPRRQDWTAADQHGVNDMLARARVRTGFNAKLTAHGIRKSAGTIMARQNKRYAREQLGITKKVFDQNYNQPTVEDRLERRDLVPAAGVQAGPDEIVG